MVLAVMVADKMVLVLIFHPGISAAAAAVRHPCVADQRFCARQAVVVVVPRKPAPGEEPVGAQTVELPGSIQAVLEAMQEMVWEAWVAARGRTESMVTTVA